MNVEGENVVSTTRYVDEVDNIFSQGTKILPEDNIQVEAIESSRETHAVAACFLRVSCMDSRWTSVSYQVRIVV